MVNVRGGDRPPAPPPVPPARRITAWIMRPHDELTDDDRVGLKDARARCPELDTLADLAHGFNQLVRHRAGHRLEEWINQATQGPFPEIRGFAAGLLRDFDAVRNGLTQHWSSGAVESNINRVKRSSDKCTAAPASVYSESESSSPRDAAPQDQRQNRIT
jgi:hypothetical protein